MTLEDVRVSEPPQLSEAERTIASLATILGWMNVPPRHVLEAEIRALKGRAARSQEEKVNAELLAACKHVVTWFARLNNEQTRKTHRSIAEAEANWPTLGDETGPLDLQPVIDAIAKAEALADPGRPPQGLA